MSKRRIVQIAASDSQDGDAIMYALCDDGTLWRCRSDAGGWSLVRNVPQGKVDKHDYTHADLDDAG